MAISDPERACYASSQYDDFSMGDSTAEDMNLIGAFAPSLRSSTWLTLSLAEAELRDFAFFPGASGFTPPMLVVCNDAAAAIDDSVGHLVDTLRVRAVLASFDESAQPASLLAAGESALLLSPDGTLDGAPNAAYWHLGGDYGAVAAAYPPLFRALAPRLEQRAQSTGRPWRIAVVVSTGASGRIAGLASESLEVGGQTREQLEVLDRLRFFELTDALRERSVADLVAYAPDLVLLNATGVFGSFPRQERAEVVGLLEAAAAQAALPPPLYLLGPRRATDTYLDTLSARDASFRARAVSIGIDSPGGAEEAALRARFAATYGELTPRAPIGLAPRVYDAFFYLTFASAAARDGSALTVESMRRGLSQVTDPAGSVVQLGGSEGLSLARELLLAGEPFDLNGVTGARPLDPTRELPVASPVIACWGDDGKGAVLASFDGKTWTTQPGLCAAQVLDGPLE